MGKGVGMGIVSPVVRKDNVMAIVGTPGAPWQEEPATIAALPPPLQAGEREYDLAKIELRAMVAARASLAEQQAHPDKSYGVGKISWSFPEEQALFSAHWWTLPEAAAAWGCSYRTARRWAITQSGRAHMVYILRRRGGCWRWVVPVNLIKSPSPIGNPYFRDGAYQRDLINRRWDDQRNKARATRKPLREAP